MKNLKWALLTALLIGSCTSTRKSLETDNSTGEKITESGTRTREGGTVTQELPYLYNFKYKDTTIVTTNYETKQMIRTVFDKDGNQTIECISDEINERFDRMEERFQNDLSAELERENELKPQHLLYAVAGIILSIAILGVVLVVIMVRAQKAAPKLMADAMAEIVKAIK